MLSDPLLTEQLSNQIRKADRAIMFSVIGIFVLIILMFGAILWQNQVNADASRATATENHRRTQAYVKCIGEQQLVPLAQREENALDKCTVNADNQTKEDK